MTVYSAHLDHIDCDSELHVLVWLVDALMHQAHVAAVEVYIRLYGTNGTLSRWDSVEQSVHQSAAVRGHLHNR